MADPVTQSLNGSKRKLQVDKELLIGMLASSSYTLAITRYLASLPAYVDDAERDFGLDLYERMMKDPTISSSINALKAMCLSDEPRFMVPVNEPSKVNPDPEQEADYQRAVEIRDFVESMCNNLQQPLEEILNDMLDFLPFGHKLAEKVYESDGGRMVLKKLRTKPRKSYGFVVTKYMDFVGILPAVNGYVSTSSEVDSKNVIPREKFFLLSFAPKNGDPRGTSLIRAAYNAWYMKQQTWPQYLKFLSQFGTPSIVGFLPQDAGEIEVIDELGNAVVDDDGNVVTKQAAEMMLEQLLKFANGTAIVLEHGADFDLIQSQGDGGAYVKAFDIYDRQMTKAIMIAVRATMEAEHGSKADSGTAQDIVAEFAQSIQRKVEVGFYRDIILPTVRMNFGDEAAEKYCPYMSLSDVAREDVVAVGNMIANLARADMVHSSQLPGIDAKLNLPERDFQAQMDEEQERAESAKDMRQMLQGMNSPETDSVGDEDDGA